MHPARVQGMLVHITVNEDTWLFRTSRHLWVWWKGSRLKGRGRRSEGITWGVVATGLQGRCACRGRGSAC
eukprot:scaffold288205_cov17-Tisochrysis_lutea.AAC.1